MLCNPKVKLIGNRLFFMLPKLMILMMDIIEAYRLYGTSKIPVLHDF